MNFEENLKFEEKWDILDDSIKDSKLDLFLFRLVFSCTRFWFHCYALLKYFFFVPQSISRFIPLDSWASFCQLFRSKSNRNWIENFHICFYKGRSSLKTISWFLFRISNFVVKKFRQNEICSSLCSINKISRMFMIFNFVV